MDSFEWNKIIGAVLGSLIFIFVVKTIGENIYEAEKPAKPGYVVEGVVEEGAGPATAEKPEEAPDWGTVLASADAGAGKTVSGRCLQCHTLGKGEPNKIGPNIYGVVERPRASVDGFSYSSAMKSKGGTWSYDELFKFLKSPGAYINGTKMSFAGLRNAQDRINLIAFLRTNADSPAAIPAPAPKKEEAPAAAPPAGPDAKAPAGAATEKPAAPAADKPGPNGAEKK
ncbi:MAG: cytochrome c family protein [Alphaproteobacteria bacterium]|nr:cytochrome c family protein [Alphaproteobacteria bacterium]